MLCAMVAPDSFEVGADDGYATARDEFVSAGQVDDVVEAAEACSEQASTIIRHET
jgi:ferredoxin